MEDIADLHAFMQGVLSKEGCRSITVGGIENHIHILAEFPLDKVGGIISITKTAATRWLKARNPLAYASFSWQRGYGLFSVSFSVTDKVRQYIKTQRERHGTLAPRDEYIKFLKRHHIDYDHEDVDVTFTPS